MVDRPVILVPTGFYLPGFKAGGPVRSIAHLVDSIGDEFHFKIICADRDLGNSQPYEGIAIDRWVKAGKAEVYYVPSYRWRMKEYLRIIRSTPHDVLYLNSFFSAAASIAPLAARRLGLLAPVPVVLAPRGELSQGALQIKPMKKRAYLLFGTIFGFFRTITWQASSDFEVQDIRTSLNKSTLDVRVAPNLLVCSRENGPLWAPRGAGQGVRIAFVSRLSRKKNLDYAFRVLELVTTPVSFSIYGPVEDGAHYVECRRLAEQLPPHVKVRWHGAVEPADVPSIMAAHDLFFLPTRGENFGHVIAEALGACTPVLVSDTTPWRGLQAAGVGWDLPLSDPQAFAAVIDVMAGQDNVSAQQQRERVLEFARLRQESSGDIEANRDLFRLALDTRR